MEKHLNVSINASYCTLNQLSLKTQKVWLVFHGQGMLAKFFVKKFEILDQDKNFIIAPQGLSKYYLEGYNGRVGASWMTSEDRLTEIDNQITYVKEVLKKEITENFTYELILFGFSQGVATACRFGAFSGYRFQKLILWAGLFPEDLKTEEVAHWPGNLEIKYFTGNQDPFLFDGLQEKQKELVEKATGITPKKVEFDGKHEVLPELLLDI